MAARAAVKRLVHITTVADTIRAFLLPYAKHFRAQGWLVDAIAYGASGYSEIVNAFDRTYDLPVNRNPLTLTNLVAIKSLSDHFASERYDIVHVHTPVASVVCRCAVARLPRGERPRVIYTAHGFHFYSGGPRATGLVYRLIERAMGKWTDRLVVINKEDHESALRYRIVDSNRVQFMPGIGVDTRKYSPDNICEREVLTLRANLGLSENDRAIVMIGEFIKRKRHEDIIRALSIMDSKHCHLLFAGVGPLLNQMRELSVSLDVSDRCHFLGFRRDVPVLLRASVASVLPSEREGLPRSMMESMCLGVPVIGTKIRGITDLVDNTSGWVVDVGDIPALAHAMEECLRNPDDAREKGLQAQSLLRKYDIERLLEMHEILYTDVLLTDNIPVTYR